MNTSREREKMLVTIIFSFSTMFSTIQKQISNLETHFIYRLLRALSIWTSLRISSFGSRVTVFLLINAPVAIQNKYRELYFVPNLKSKMSIQFCISLSSRDCQDKIFIKLGEIFIKFLRYCYFNPFPHNDAF